MTRALFTSAVLAFASSVATADTITVCLDGSCDYTDIQSAINAASDGDVIEIAAGTYYPAATIDTLGKAVTLRGKVGKDGKPKTVIDGQDSIRVLQCISGESTGTNFEYLLIKNGWAELFDVYQNGDILHHIGGGMLVANTSSPTVIGCWFEDNYAHEIGGGLGCVDFASPTLTNCTFVNNSAYSGGGMGSMYFCSPVLANCVFLGNSADEGMLSEGSAIWDCSGDPSFLDCSFTANEGGFYGSVVYLAFSDSGTLENCVFENNSAGGLVIDEVGKLLITNCTFSGGSVSIFESAAELIDCVFTKNSGWSLYLFNEKVVAELLMCTFSDNPGGGMYNCGSPTLTNCTFTANDGAIWNDCGSPTLTNCTFTECCQVVPPNSFIDNGGNDFAGNIYVACDECRADVDCDEEVNAADLGLLLSAWNTTEAQYDIDGDGVVGGGDLGMLLGTWGACP